MAIDPDVQEILDAIFVRLDGLEASQTNDGGLALAWQATEAAIYDRISGVEAASEQAKILLKIADDIRGAG